MNETLTGTVKERLTRIEVILNNHLEHHRFITRWLLGVSIASTSGMVLLIVPGFVKWLAGVV
jgi:hypothetical protein